MVAKVFGVVGGGRCCCVNVGSVMGCGTGSVGGGWGNGWKGVTWAGVGSCGKVGREGWAEGGGIGVGIVVGEAAVVGRVCWG